MSEKKSLEIFSSEEIKGLIYCPHCGRLTGLKFDPPNVKKIRFKIGEKELPELDLIKHEDKDPIVFCDECGREFMIWEAIVKEET